MPGPSRVTLTRVAGDVTAQIATSPLTYCAMAGICEMGPIGSAGVVVDGAIDPVTSWAEWQGIYGAFTANAQDLPLSVKAFFDEGGQLLYTSRVVHCTTPGDAASKTSAAATLNLSTASVTASAAFVTGSASGPWALTASGQFLDVIIDSNSSVQAVFTFVGPHRDSGAGTFALSNNDTLTAVINGQSLTFTFVTAAFVSIGAATAAEVAAVLNAKFASLNPSARAQASVTGSAVRIASLWLGTGASINITGGSANGVLGFTTGALAGTGNVADSAAITGAEAKSIVEAAVSGCTWTTSGAGTITSNTTGTGSHVQVKSNSTAVAFGFDNALHTGGASGTQSTLRADGRWDGTYANALSLRVSAPASGASARFDLDVMRGGLAVESWRDVSLDATDPSYAPSLVNLGSGTQKASKLITLADLAATFPSPNNLPAVGTFGPLAGGADGLGSLADIDFYGSKANSSATGLRCFDQISRIDVAAIPGRETASAANQLATWCAVVREGKTFFATGVPRGSTLAAARAYLTSTAALKGVSEIGAAYAPWIYVDNPDTAVFGTAATVLAPVEGAILGLYARTDASKEGGAFVHPAGSQAGRLTTARGLETAEYEDATLRGLFFDDLGNPIRRQRGKPIYVDGARSLKRDGAAFPSVGESRGAMFVANQLAAAFDDARQAPINDALYASLAAGARVFLGKLTKAGAFRTKIDAQAYLIDFGAGLNTPDVVEASEVLGTVGLATSPAAEFIFVSISPFRGLAAKFAQQAAQQVA